MVFFIQLFLAHIIGDFFLQPAKWVADKEQKKWRSVYLYMHAVIHFCLVLCVTADITLWLTALIVAIVHLVIDIAKLMLQTPRTRRRWFFLDQAMHLIALLAIYMFSRNVAPNFYWLSNEKLMMLIAAIAFIITPSSIIIRNVISRWSPYAAGMPNPTDSLEKAGQLIGIMERLLVFVFICVGKWEGVGFLLAAKSVFRFGDLKDAQDKRLTEYVLIGTLLSFGLAILAGLIASAFMVRL